LLNSFQTFPQEIGVSIPTALVLNEPRSPQDSVRKTQENPHTTDKTEIGKFASMEGCLRIGAGGRF